MAFDDEVVEGGEVGDKFGEEGWSTKTGPTELVVADDERLEGAGPLLRCEQLLVVERTVQEGTPLKHQFCEEQRRRYCSDEWWSIEPLIPVEVVIDDA
jgi:hypothetical protein